MATWLIVIGGSALVALTGVMIGAMGETWSARLLAIGTIAHGVTRATSARNALVRELGRLPAFGVILAAGSALVVAVCWPAGAALRRLERAVDVPVFDWFASHQTELQNQIMRVLTLMGNRPYVKAVIVVAAIVFLLAGARMLPRWLPPLVLVLTFLVIRYEQVILARVVARGHPPTTHGTYPSGGCARLIGVYGTLLLFLLVVLKVRRQWRVVAWTTLAVLAYIEGYTRIYLLKHWATDVLGGWLFGALVLGVVAAASTALLVERPQRGSDEALSGEPQRGEGASRTGSTVG